MRGKYTEPELRAITRAHWASDAQRASARREIEALRPLLDRDDGLVVIDVGANKGAWSKALLDTLGETVARIHMLEPSPENHRELTRREDSLVFDASDFARLSAYPVAAGARSGVADLHTNEDGSPLATFYPRLTGEAVEPDAPALSEVTVAPVVTLDSFMAGKGMTRVDLLKIDVEGHEFPVLQGADASLRAGRIQAVRWDFGPRQLESRHFFADFHRFLSARGYDLYRLENDAFRPLERYDRALEVFTETRAYAAARRNA